MYDQTVSSINTMDQGQLMKRSIECVHACVKMREDLVAFSRDAQPSSLEDALG